MALTGKMKEARDLLDEIKELEKLRKDLQLFDLDFQSQGIRKIESAAREKLAALKGKL